MEGLQWIAEIAFRHVWQGVLIFSIVGLLLYQKDKWSAEHRSWIWAVAVFLLGAMPILTLLPTPSLNFMPSLMVGQEIAITEGKTGPLASALNNAYRYDPALVQPVTQTIDNSFLSRSLIMAVLVGLWFFVSVRALCGLFMSWKTTRKLRADSKPLENAATILPPDWPEYARVGVTDKVNGPMAVGLLRPSILLPTHLVKILPREQLRHVLAHELAHIERGDLLCAFGQRVLLALYWWSPFMHGACKNLRTEREMACDDRAVRKAGCSRHYASSLLDSVEALIREPDANKNLLAVGAFESGRGNFFSHRIKRLINADYQSQLRLGRPQLTNLVGAMAVIVLLFVLSPRTAFSAVLPVVEEAYEYTLHRQKDLEIKASYASTRSALGVPAYNYDTRTSYSSSKADSEFCCSDFMEAIYDKDHKTKLELFRKGANLNCQEGEETPLIAATHNSDLATMMWLLDKGADINLVADGHSALMEAVSHGYVSAAKKLLQHGADPNYVSDQHGSVLMAAIDKNNVELVKLLVENGASLNYTSYHHGKKLTVIEYADHHDQEKISAYLNSVKPRSRG
ncbi:M56 family metallopeptidase [Parvularcula sp. IMCC14364]|uniref:M56 family metallopeptidase n=1 Tax=Parvularcula sp. IMCC14364 TaxID=3067902 RepID=UPI002741EF66|nr:M56 family metallopeptidase [Parvularcula sp. IMCC14364]